MAAISTTLMQLCNSGDHIVASSTVYGTVPVPASQFNVFIGEIFIYEIRFCPAGGTFALLKSFLPAKCGISTTFVDISDLEAVRAAITDQTKVRCEHAVTSLANAPSRTPAAGDAKVVHTEAVSRQSRR
jgi:methionine-gamma-lyase